MKTSKTAKVTITNKTNGSKSRAINLSEARVQLAKMLKWWRQDRGSEQFPYLIEAA